MKTGSNIQKIGGNLEKENCLKRKNILDEYYQKTNYRIPKLNFDFAKKDNKKNSPFKKLKRKTGKKDIRWEDKIKMGSITRIKKI